MAVVAAVGLGVLASWNYLSYARSKDGSPTGTPLAEYVASKSDGKVLIKKNPLSGRPVAFDPNHQPLFNTWTPPLAGKIRTTTATRMVNATFWDDSANSNWVKQQQFLDDSGIRNQQRHNTLDENDPLAAPTTILHKLLPPRTARINGPEKHAFDFRRK